MALSISFIRYGSCKSFKEGLKNFCASSKVVMPRCANKEAMSGLTFKTVCKCRIIAGVGCGFNDQRIVYFLFQVKCLKQIYKSYRLLVRYEEGIFNLDEAHSFKSLYIYNSSLNFQAAIFP